MVIARIVTDSAISWPCVWNRSSRKATWRAKRKVLAQSREQRLKLNRWAGGKWSTPCIHRRLGGKTYAGGESPALSAAVRVLATVRVGKIK